MDDPRITEYNKKGYSKWDNLLVGYDYFDRPIYEGDELLKLDDDVYVVEELSVDARVILSNIGASTVFVKKGGRY